MNMIKISLIDDHKLVREGIGNLIRNFPQYQIVSEHDNGKEFIDSLITNDLPNIVLLDINMPIMDGFETALCIKNKFPSISVLALSMLDDDASIIKMIRNGAKGYILKNTSAVELEIALDAILKDGFYYNHLTNDKLNEINNSNLIQQENFGLTNNELKYIYYSALEKTTKEIADLLFVSIRTLEYYRVSVYEKTSTKTKIGMILFAIKHKLIDLDL